MHGCLPIKETSYHFTNKIMLLKVRERWLEDVRTQKTTSGVNLLYMSTLSNVQDVLIIINLSEMVIHNFTYTVDYDRSHVVQA